MANFVSLTFETVPERVVFEGFNEEILSELRAFMVRVQADDSELAPYRVVVAGGQTLRMAVNRSVPTRRPFRRHLQQDGDDLLQMPGCRLRLAPGQPEAAVEFRAGSAGVDGFVLTTLLETALTHALAMSGYVVNHAAAFEVDGTAVLAVGPTRAGKSTLSAAALAAGGAVVSDDSVILGPGGEGRPFVGALRRNLWLREGSIGMLPRELRSGLREAESFGERRWGLDRDVFAGYFRPTVRPGAVVLLRRDRRLRGFRLREVSSADGLVGLILATSSLYLSSRYPIERERCMPGLMKLVNSAPCFEVRMGTELVDDPVTTVQRLAEAVSL